MKQASPVCYSPARFDKKFKLQSQQENLSWSQRRRRRSSLIPPFFFFSLSSFFPRT